MIEQISDHPVRRVNRDESGKEGASLVFRDPSAEHPNEQQPSIIADLEDALKDVERFGIEKQRNLKNEADLQASYNSS